VSRVGVDQCRRYDGLLFPPAPFHCHSSLISQTCSLATSILRCRFQVPYCPLDLCPFHCIIIAFLLMIAMDHEKASSDSASESDLFIPRSEIARRRRLWPWILSTGILAATSLSLAIRLLSMRCDSRPLWKPSDFRECFFLAAELFAM